VEICNNAGRSPEAQVPYNSDFTPEKGVLRAKNAYAWDVNPKISNG